MTILDVTDNETINNNIKELKIKIFEDKIEHIENTYKPIGLVTIYVKHLKKDLKALLRGKKWVEN